MAKEKEKKSSLKEYFRGVRTEMKKVVWPTRKEVVSYTAVVIAVCAAFAVAFATAFAAAPAVASAAVFATCTGLLPEISKLRPSSGTADSSWRV